MNDKLSIPTDNIYKFYALFSLVLTVFFISSFIYLNAMTNDLITTTTIKQAEILERLQGPSNQQVPIEAEIKFKSLQSRVDVEIKNRNDYIFLIMVGLFVAISLGVFGFFKWHTTVQPLADEMALVQLNIAQLQLLKLKQEIN